MRYWAVDTAIIPHMKTTRSMTSGRSFGAAVGIAVCSLILGVVKAREVVTDSDHDGVADSRDQCPDTAQLHKVPAEFRYRHGLSAERYSRQPEAWPVDESGCEPDSDGDGLIDSQDYCPGDSPEAISKGVAENGCPKHSDGDGTPDWRDRCPDTPRGVATDRYGCPVDVQKGMGMGRNMPTFSEFDLNGDGKPITDTGHHRLQVRAAAQSSPARPGFVRIR
jgi:hypothetical protein